MQQTGLTGPHCLLGKIGKTLNSQLEIVQQLGSTVTPSSPTLSIFRDNEEAGRHSFGICDYTFIVDGIAFDRASLFLGKLEPSGHHPSRIEATKATSGRSRASDGRRVACQKEVGPFSCPLPCPAPAYKVELPITTLIRDLSILGSIPKGSHIFQRCVFVSSIKLKLNYNFQSKL